MGKHSEGQEAATGTEGVQHVAINKTIRIQKKIYLLSGHNKIRCKYI